MRPTILSDDPKVFEKTGLIKKIREICHAGGDFGRVLYEQLPEFSHWAGPGTNWIYLKPVADKAYKYAVPDWGLDELKKEIEI